MVHLYLPVFLSELYVSSFSLQWFCKKSSTNFPNPATDFPEIKSYDSLFINVHVYEFFII